MPADLGVLNAANLCPASRPVLEALTRESDSVDRDPSRAEPRPADRREGEAPQDARGVPARHARRDRHHPQHQRGQQHGLERPRPEGRRRSHRLLRTTTRATSRRGTRRRKRFGFTVVDDRRRRTRIPGMEYYIDAYTKAITPQTKVLTLHASLELGRRSVPGQGAVRAGARARRDVAASTARSRSACSTSTSPTSQPDFYTGSAHKWPCGARECGVLYINTRAQQEHLAVDLQRLSRRGRHLEDVRELRPA